MGGWFRVEKGVEKEGRKRVRNKGERRSGEERKEVERERARGFVTIVIALSLSRARARVFFAFEIKQRPGARRNKRPAKDAKTKGRGFDGGGRGRRGRRESENCSLSLSTSSSPPLPLPLSSSSTIQLTLRQRRPCRTPVEEENYCERDEDERKVSRKKKTFFASKSTRTPTRKRTNKKTRFLRPRRPRLPASDRRKEEMVAATQGRTEGIQEERGKRLVVVLMIMQAPLLSLLSALSFSDQKNRQQDGGLGKEPCTVLYIILSSWY